jgi:hypothetical protein
MVFPLKLRIRISPGVNLLRNDTQSGRQFKSPGLPTLICQEGGYNLNVIGECVKNFLRVFPD